ncbi:MAG TPA: AgmX/PglI C-terminal domain-containing protein [Chitinispirillaceae bacterium]|nr:AgmX/PglI C-terminal domain-containing protein [Chitinispirillaceae bacterium]
MGYTITVNRLYEEEVEQAGRILSLGEFIEKIKTRTDIFQNDQNTLIGRVEGVCLVSALLAGYLLSISKIDLAQAVHSDFFEAGMREVNAIVQPDYVERPQTEVNHITNVSVKRPLKPTPAATADNRQLGRAAGSPKDRVAKAGIFAMMSQPKIKGVDAAFGDIAGKGGYTETIDAVLSGLGGLKQGSGSNSGRRGVSNLGFGTGYGLTGDGDGSGIGDIGSLTGYQTLDIRYKERNGTLRHEFPTTGGKIAVGGRSRSSIMAVVFQNIPALRYLYNSRLNLIPGLKGKITVKFAVDEFGNVLHCEIVESSIRDAELEQKVVAKIKAWRFDKIDKPGDVTEVLYPFVFAAG